LLYHKIAADALVIWQLSPQVLRISLNVVKKALRVLIHKPNCPGSPVDPVGKYPYSSKEIPVGYLHSIRILKPEPFVIVYPCHR